MNQQPVVIFVCEHGAAKSILAAAYFNQLALEANLDSRAIARGTNPDLELSPKTLAGLYRDGLASTESAPQKLNPAEVKSAERVISFCELPEEYRNDTIIEHWEDIPPVSEDYEKARDVIVQHIRKFIETM